MGAPKSLNNYNVTKNFLNIIYLLPEDDRFKHGGAKIASCSVRQLTLLSPVINATKIQQ